jgi:hypothetical protein
MSILMYPWTRRKAGVPFVVAVGLSLLVSLGACGCLRPAAVHGFQSGALMLCTAGAVLDFHSAALLAAGHLFWNLVSKHTACCVLGKRTRVRVLSAYRAGVA